MVRSVNERWSGGQPCELLEHGDAWNCRSTKYPLTGPVEGVHFSTTLRRLNTPLTCVGGGSVAGTVMIWARLDHPDCPPSPRLDPVVQCAACRRFWIVEVGRVGAGDPDLLKGPTGLHRSQDIEAQHGSRAPWYVQLTATSLKPRASAFVFCGIDGGGGNGTMDFA